MTIKIFEKEIPLYGLLFFLGIGVAAIVAFFLVKKRHRDVFDFVCAAVYVMIGAMIGAKLLFLLVSFKEIIQLKLSFEEIIRGGFVFYGGLLGGVVGLLLYGRQFQVDIIHYADIFAAVLPLGHAFGRIGCFFAGCCYGIPYDGVGSICYQHSNNIFTPIGVELFPVQIVEAACLSVLFIVLIWVLFHHQKPGRVTKLYLGSYATLRLFLEFLRGDVERGGMLGLSTSQWVSLLILGYIVLRAIWKKEVSN